MNPRKSPRLPVGHFSGREGVCVRYRSEAHQLRVIASFCLSLYLTFCSLTVSYAQPEDPPQVKDSEEQVGLKEENLDTTPESQLQAIKITLYPQHDEIELINSDQIMASWPLFYGYVLDHMPQALSKKVLEHFLQWKSTQGLFTSLLDLEKLQTSLSDHLMSIEQSSEVDIDHFSQQEKLKALLSRLNRQKINLKREDEWLEQQQILQNKQVSLEELNTAEKDLIKALDELLKRFQEKIDHSSSLQQSPQEEEEIEDKPQLDELETALGALTLFHRSLRSRELKLKQCMQSLESLLLDSAELLRTIPQLRKANQDRLRTLGLWRSYWVTRNQLEQRYEKSSEDSLLSQISGQQETIETRWNGLKELGAELKAKQQTFRVNYLDPLEMTSPPKISKILTKTAYDKVKRAHDNATQFLTFHSTRKSQLDQTISEAEILLNEVDSFIKKIRLSWEDIIEVDVLALNLQRSRPLTLEQISVDGVLKRSLVRKSETRAYQLVALRESWDRYNDHLSSELTAWKKTLDDDKAAILRIKQKIFEEGGLANRLELERVWLAFVEEIKGLDGPSLLKKHSEALSLYTEQETKIKGLRREYDQVKANFQDAWRALQELSDPLLRQHKIDSAGFVTHIQQLESLIKELPSGESADRPVERSSEKTLKRDPNQQKGKINDRRKLPPHRRDHENTLEGDREISDRVSHHDKIIRVLEVTRLLRDQLPPRIAYYRQFLYKIQDLEELWGQREKLILSLQGEYAKRVEFARQVRRTASVIRLRILDQDLPMEAMTDEIENHGQREWVEQLRAESLDDLQSQLAYDRHLLVLEPDYIALTQTVERLGTLLGEILELSSRQLRSISEALKEESSSESVQRRDQKSIEGKDKAFALKTLGERQFEHGLQLRMDEDYPWYDGFWSSFSNEYLDNLEALLKDHYVELIKTEKAQQHIEERIKLTKSLAEAVAAQRPLLESYQKELLQVTQRMNHRFITYRTEAELRLDPQISTKQLRLENSASALHLDFLMTATIEGKAARQEVLGELEQQWTMYKIYEAACKELDERLSPQGILEEVSGEVQDAISQLETERDELNPPLKRLLGNRARGVDLTQDLPFIGEIDRLHQERIRIKLRVVLLSLLSFLLIPLITFVSLRAIGTVERRIRRLSERELERLSSEGEALSRQKRAEREDRLDTLLQVMRTTSKLLIFTIATGAMLKTLHVDVTPIIASAGIIGLAFAFGAQELVKDFFAGIFILFENQYNRGDFVTINGIFGWIDKITLRITVIRDSHGVIHFIPNGQVLLVSNHNKEWSQAHLEIGASYNNAPKQVIDCLRELCKEISIDPVIGEDVLGWEVLGLERFDDSAVVYRVHLKTAPKEKWRVARHYRKRVMEVFADEGIEIPFPQLVVTRSSTSTLESEQL